MRLLLHLKKMIKIPRTKVISKPNAIIENNTNPSIVFGAIYRHAHKLIGNNRNMSLIIRRTPPYSAITCVIRTDVCEEIVHDWNDGQCGVFFILTGSSNINYAAEAHVFAVFAI